MIGVDPAPHLAQPHRLRGALERLRADGSSGFLPFHPRSFDYGAYRFQLVASEADGDVEKALATAEKAWPAWRDRPLPERAMLLEKLADIMEQDRFRMAALQTFEVGKPWHHADADVAEHEAILAAR